MADIRIKDLATTATSSASDDYLALDGSTNGTRKILATNVANNVTDVIFGTSGPSAKSSIAARAARQGLVFDGTVGATVASVAAFGTGDFTFASWVNPTSLAAGQYLIGGALAAGSFNAAINATTGVLTAYNGTSYTPSPNQSVVAGKWQLVVYRRASGVLYVSVNAGTEGSVACTENFSTVTSEIGALDGAGFFKGQIIPLIYNRALSAAEVVSLYEAGVPAGADYNTASNTAVNTATATNDGSFPYTSFTGATASAFTAVKASGGAYAKFNPIFALTVGQRINVSGTLTLNNGKTVLPSIAVLTSGLSGIAAGVSLTAAGAFSIDLTCTTAGSGFVTVSTSGDADYTLSGVVAKRTGLLLAPDAAQSGGGLTWYDTSGNAANITLPATGVSWNVPTSGRGIFADGTAAAPSISFSADSDTGLYRGGSGLVVFSSNGTASLSFNTAGQIGGATANYLNLPTGGAVSLVAGGTNQNITLVPSGSGIVDCINKMRAGGGVSGVPASGSGVEIEVVSATGRIFAYDRTGGFALPLIIQSPGGNTLIGTTTDSGALLQIGTNTTTSAGGMVFGTDTGLYRTASGQITLNDTGTTQATYGLSEAGTLRMYLQYTGGVGYLATVGSNSLVLRTANTAALTLSSTQAATFASTVQTTNIGLGAAPLSAPKIYAYGGANNEILRAASGVDGPTSIILDQTTRLLRFVDGSGPTNRMTLDMTTGAATFSGSVALGGALKLANAYVAGAVVGTGYVTIQDSTGTTYRVPVLV